GGRARRHLPGAPAGEPAVTALDELRPSRRWRPVRWAALAVAILAVGFGAVFGMQLGTDPTLVDSPLIGRPVPTRELPYLERGGALSLTELRGQIVVVNFWASWCAACRQEHPALVAAAGDYQAAGVTFVGVDYQDRSRPAIGFLDEMGRGPGRYVTDPGSQLALDFGVFGIPETFFVDRTGTIVAKITGPTSRALLSRVLDAILAGRRPESRTNGTVAPAPAPLSPGGPG
ncbi:MAG: TlpA family protein disulfide reductase, partial [Candidatus Dormibacteria bacterium]